ncbi:MAG: hypothetical protein H0X54_00325 [Propionibacteriales bacterium]|jgi:hypothetical protein|nr:hypothetical protein [Propionibacteriales bacterium]
MRATISTADESTIRVLDGLVIFWLVLWLFIGAWSAVTIWHVGDIGDTISNSGRALETAGTALTKVGSVPIIGDEAGELGNEVVTTAADVASRGQEVKGQLRQLAVMLGLSIIVMPTTPVVGMYLPLRLARRREISGIRQALAQHGGDARLDRYLAERALDHLPFTSVRSLSPDPWRDIAEGKATKLADAELERLGLRRPRV